MINFSLSEKLVQLKDIIVSSPFFFVSVIIGIILLIIMIVGVKKNRRINNIIFIVSWIFVAVFCIARYFKFFVSIFDRLFGRIVDEIYFPSISIYTVMLIITNIIFVSSMFKKKVNSLNKIINVGFAMLLDFLFILILDTIMKNNIDVSAKFDIYTNSSLLILLELSMTIFLIWLLIIGVLYLINKYGVKKVFVNEYKENDYEIIDTKNTDIKDDGYMEIIDTLEEKTNISNDLTNSNKDFSEIINLEDDNTSKKDNIEIMNI